MDYIEIMGLVAATLTTSSFVPQVYKTWRKKSAEDISLTMYLAFFIGVVLWIIYGVMIGSLPVTLANSITVLLVLSMLVMKFKY